jgi:hypothetical protein
MNKEVLGYKGFDKDLKCKDFQYEIGKLYEMEEEPSICVDGFHYCEKLIDVFRHKSSNCRICKVRAYGDIVTLNNKSCTNKIEILEELNISKEDRIRYVYALWSHLSNDKVEELLNKEFVLDDYINSRNTYVRKAVAKQGYGLDILINDSNEYVRLTALNYIRDNKPEVCSQIADLIKSAMNY